MNNNELRKRKIDLIIRDLNRQLKIAADEKIAIDLEIEDVSKQSDKVKRIYVHVLEEDSDKSSSKTTN